MQRLLQSIYQKISQRGMRFKSFHTAKKTLTGYETMHMTRKGQIKEVEKGDKVFRRPVSPTGIVRGGR